MNCLKFFNNTPSVGESSVTTNKDLKKQGFKSLPTNTNTVKEAYTDLRNRKAKEYLTSIYLSAIPEFEAVDNLRQIIDPKDSKDKWLTKKAFEDVIKTPEDIISRGHPNAFPTRGGPFSYWYNENKTNPKLQEFLSKYQNTEISQKVKQQIIRYEIDAPYELMRKSFRISRDEEIPSCFMLKQEDLFDSNNNYITANPKLEINDLDNYKEVFEWFFRPTPFLTWKKNILLKTEYETNRSLESGMYSESEVAKKLQKYIAEFENNLQTTANYYWQEVHSDN